MNDNLIESKALKDFINKLCMFTHCSQYEEDSLLEAAAKGEKKFVMVLGRVCGTPLNDAFRETAYGCWKLMLVIRELMEIAGPDCTKRNGISTARD